MIDRVYKEYIQLGMSPDTFNVLPESKEQDHAVELIPGSKPSRCMVYPLSPTEQKELDAFFKGKTLRGARSNLLNLQCHPQYFSLKKRMALSSLSKTIDL